MNATARRLSTAVRRFFFAPLTQEISAVLNAKLDGGLKLISGQLTSFQGQLTSFQGKLTGVQGQLTSLRKDVSHLATQQGQLFELAASDVLHQQLAVGPPRTLRRAEDFAAVLRLEGDPLLPTATSLVYTLLLADVGFWHLLLHSVMRVSELARGKAPTSSVAMAAKELQEMDAERLVQATATAAAAAAAESVAVGSYEQCTSSSGGEAQLQQAYLPKVVDLLHRSGQGCMLFADELEVYLSVKGSAAARAHLLLGHIAPFLTAVATGVAVSELEVDRCSSVSLRSWAPVPSADLQLGELKMSSSGFKAGRKQVKRNATALAWAYHAARLGGAAQQGGAGGAVATTRPLPPVLNVHAHLFSLPNGHPKQPQPEAYRVEVLPVLGCPLTVYYTYHTVRSGRVQHWRW